MSTQVGDLFSCSALKLVFAKARFISIFYCSVFMTGDRKGDGSIAAGGAAIHGPGQYKISNYRSILPESKRY